ncbi:hypothetical protein BH10BAC1_BH10BAC1_05710 [soil metagenome]
MKKTPLILLVILLITSCLTIERVPSKKNDDGYSSLSDANKKLIHDFSLGEQKSGERAIQWINAAELQNIAKNNNKTTWLIIWASWCPHSINLIDQKRILFSEKHKETMTTILIAQNINLDYQLALLDKIKYQGNLYILNSKQYGTDENMKSVTFLNELKVDFKEIIKSTPINILLSVEGNVLKIKYGENITDDFFNH